MSIQSPARVPATGRAVIAVIVTAASLLALAGVIAVGLGAAFPLAVGIIHDKHLAVPAADLALAERFAGFAWAFVAAGVAALAAAFVVPVLFASRRPAGLH
jgi:hypothetical protein